MGSTYANVTVVGGGLEAVRSELAGTGALLAASGDDVVVFSPHDDGEHLGSTETADRLSAALGVPAVLAIVVDEDFLSVMVMVGGTTAAMAVAPPNGAEILLDELGDAVDDADEHLGGAPTPDPATAAAALVAAVGRGQVAAVTEALLADNVFATESHHDVFTALGLPTLGVGWGHRYLAQDQELFEQVPLVEA